MLNFHLNFRFKFYLGKTFFTLVNQANEPGQEDLIKIVLYMTDKKLTQNFKN